MRSGKLGGAFVEASVTALVAMVGLLALSAEAPVASASTIEGDRYQWDSEPVFAQTELGGRIFLVRDSYGPEDGPFGPARPRCASSFASAGAEPEFSSRRSAPFLPLCGYKPDAPYGR